MLNLMLKIVRLSSDYCGSYEGSITAYLISVSDHATDSIDIQSCTKATNTTTKLPVNYQQ